VKRIAVSIVMVMVMASLAGCLEDDGPYWHMTIMFATPSIEMREVGNDTLFDADLLVLKCSPKDEKIDRHEVWVNIVDRDGNFLMENDRLTSWTGVEPEGVWVYDIDGSSDGLHLQANDTLRLTGMDSRFLGAQVEVGWDRNGREQIGEITLPLVLIEVEEMRSRSGPADNSTTTINMTITGTLSITSPFEWDDTEISLRYTKGWESKYIECDLKPYSEPGDGGIQAWYIDTGTREGLVDVGDGILITGVPVEHANDPVLINRSYLIVTVPE
jgi:hypothetical protein